VAGGWGPTVYGLGTLLYRIGAPLRDVLGPCPVAVTGTRDPTPVGARLAWELGRRLAEGGYSVVTGFARGVDEGAAFVALEAGGAWRRFCPTSWIEAESSAPACCSFCAPPRSTALWRL
jgi:predicted Rossmann-fold nucleotide-binding protein